MTEKEEIRIFTRDGLKCECRIIRTLNGNNKMYLVDTPAGETWVSEDEFLSDDNILK